MTNKSNKQETPTYNSIEEACLDLSNMIPWAETQKETNSIHENEQIEIHQMAIQEALDFILQKFDTSELLPN